jgi:AAA+ superfamily predicted ATPase
VHFLLFLRKIEYYKGVLILTTNLIGHMDKAFESRISFAVEFYELGREERHRIWIDFITALDMLPTYKKGRLDNVDKWADAEINGRQIRNIIAMAGNLASADARHPRMTSAHIDQILSNTIDFCEYNNNYAARAKKQHLVY